MRYYYHNVTPAPPPRQTPMIVAKVQQKNVMTKSFGKELVKKRKFITKKLKIGG